MRVVLVSLEWPGPDHIGGVGRYAYRLGAELCELVDLTVVTLAGGTPLAGARMVELPRPSGRFARYYRLPFQVAAAIRDMSPQIVHVMGDDWALPARRPYAVVRTFLGSSWGEAMSSRGLRRFNHVVLAGLERLSRRKADVAIAIGPDSHAEFDCDFLVPPVTVTPRLTCERTDDFSAVFIGSFHGRKRGWLAQEAVAHLRREHPNAVLHVVGPASDATNWDSSVSVHHAGIDDRAVLELIAQSWMLLAPSTYEGFGIPAFEALAQGTPVVATANPGSEYLADRAENRGITLAATDDQFSAVVAEQAEGAVTRAESDAAHTAAVVSAITEEASTRFLVETIYPAKAKA